MTLITQSTRISLSIRFLHTGTGLEQSKSVSFYFTERGVCVRITIRLF